MSLNDHGWRFVSCNKSCCQYVTLPKETKMSKGFIAFFFIFALIAGVIVYTYKGGSISFGREKNVEVVEFSVIRYDGKIISSRQIIDGTGRLKTKHFLSEEKLGIAFYKYANTIRQIQSCTNSRYIPDKDGFSQSIIRKEVELE